MQPWAVIGVIVGIIALMFGIFVRLNSSIEKKIENKLNDPEFIRKVADIVRLPFVIFDEDESIIIDTGAMNYIERIEVKKEQRQDVSEIIVSPKKYMPVAPILESLNIEIEFDEPTRGQGFDLVYKTVDIATVFAKTYGSGRPPKRRFRLQVIVFPEKF